MTERTLMKPFAVLAAFAALAVPSTGSAHDEVLPASIAPRTDQEMTIQVPNERPVATTRVSVTFPSGLSVFSIARTPGWHQRVLLTKDRRLRGVVYSGGRIDPSHYETFRVLGAGARPGIFAWRVFQAYADGKVKPWTAAPERGGAPETETGPTQPGPSPATRVAVLAKAALAQTSPQQAAGAPAPARAAAAAPASSGAGIWLGVIAIALATLAIVLVGLLWSTRPARLPGDEEFFVTDEELAQLR